MCSYYFRNYQANKRLKTMFDCTIEVKSEFRTKLLKFALSFRFHFFALPIAKIIINHTSLFSSPNLCSEEGEKNYFFQQFLRSSLFIVNSKSSFSIISSSHLIFLLIRRYWLEKRSSPTFAFYVRLRENKISFPFYNKSILPNLVFLNFPIFAVKLECFLHKEKMYWQSNDLPYSKNRN
jgi:hypothetical protein